jgi:hypothetical protein
LNATIYGTDEKEEDGDASLLFGGDVILTSAQARKILEQIKSRMYMKNILSNLLRIFFAIFGYHFVTFIYL